MLEKENAYFDIYSTNVFKYFEIYKFDLKKVYETVFEMDLHI